MTKEQILRYETAASWWACWIRNKRLQDLAASYFTWKVNRKYGRYEAMLAIAARRKQAKDER